jgi:hypothetical protein
MFEEHQEIILSSLDVAHDAYYRASIFNGPSLYFHLQALEAQRKNEFHLFAQLVYAVLAAWGMHRMGPGGSKMREFGEFRDSLAKVWPLAQELKSHGPEDLQKEGFASLEKIFTGVSVMASGTSLVGNSKVLAHLLPNLIPPVDRAYTLQFLYGHGRIANAIGEEWRRLHDMLVHFFYPVVLSAQFREKAARWAERGDLFKWDTSPLKIADNLVIGLSRVPANELKQPRANTTA